MGERARRLAGDARALAHAIRDHRSDGVAFLLVIDQFEELYTLAEADQRRAFDACLADALADADCPLFVVTTVRSDFLDRIELLPRLAALYNERCKRELLPAITTQGLREAIELPARLAGLDVSEVTTAMLREARDEPGALPLVENALLQLWQQRQGNRLSGALFEQRGGLAGMLKDSADALLQRIDAEVPKGKVAALELLLSLARIDPATSTRAFASRALKRSRRPAAATMRSASACCECCRASGPARGRATRRARTCGS